MKYEWLERTQGILIIFLNHLLVMAAVITIFDLFQVENSLLLWISTIVIPFMCYKIVRKPQKLLPPPFFIIVLAILSMIEKIVDARDWQGYYFGTVFVYLAGYFVYFFLKQLSQFLLLNQTSASNIPEQEMFRNGVKQTMVFGAGSFVVLLMTANIDWMKQIADRLWNGILAILRYLLAGIETPPPVEEAPAEQVQEMASGMGDAVPGLFFPEFVRDAVITVVSGIVFISFILGCLVMLVLIYQFIKEYFMPYDRKKQTKQLQSNEDIREYCGVEKTSQTKKFVFPFWNHREKIRRLYRKKVLQRKQELIGDEDAQQLEYLTAKECCDRLSEQNLKCMYEKARYSAEDISAEDVKLAKTRYFRYAKRRNN